MTFTENISKDKAIELASRYKTALAERDRNLIKHLYGTQVAEFSALVKGEIKPLTSFTFVMPKYRDRTEVIYWIFPDKTVLPELKGDKDRIKLHLGIDERNNKAPFLSYAKKGLNPDPSPEFHLINDPRGELNIDLILNFNYPWSCAPNCGYVNDI
ncbi:MAG: hypothetical protein NXI00_04455 [Cytophagales bacterium]|nr:hypothetical protein [Cytophagales bacterium]